MYIYVVVRSDLTVAQQAVQATHAAIKASRSFLPESAIENSPNLVIVNIGSEKELLSLGEELVKLGIRFCLFQEEDLGKENTALATELISGAARRVFRKYKLLYHKLKLE